MHTTNPVIFPVIELVDRLTIAQVKHEITGANQAELDWYFQQFTQHDFAAIQSELDELRAVHRQIWKLESDIRQGKEQSLGLEEIGRRALAIRDWNNRRVQLKNSMADKLHCAVKEIKKDHASE